MLVEVGKEEESVSMNTKEMWADFKLLNDSHITEEIWILPLL